MKAHVLIGLGALLLAGCDKAQAADGTATPTAADNTKRNALDRHTDALTPIDQGESALDRGITQQVRRAVVKDDALSMSAKNAKIITVDGVVTLRGPVKSDAERDAVGILAQRADGVRRVDNQLEIAP